MLTRVDDFLGNYNNIISILDLIFPLLLTIFMLMIAYQQYKINAYLEYGRIMKEVKSDIEAEGIKIAERICELLSSKDKTINKQTLILKEIEKIGSLCSKYEGIVEYSDAQLLREAYKDFKEWIKETENFQLSLKSFLHAYNVISTLLAYLSYANYCYIIKPNKTLTLYALIGFCITKIYTFFVPYFMQKKVKKYLYPKIFKIKTIIWCFIVIKDLIKTLVNNKTPKCVKYSAKPEDSVIEGEIARKQEDSDVKEVKEVNNA